MLEQLQFKAIELAAETLPKGKKAGNVLGVEGVPSSLSQESFGAIFGKVMIWALTIAGSLAVLVLIIGGILYITAAGDQTRSEFAKKTIKSAIIGIIIILVSAVIVFALGTLFS